MVSLVSDEIDGGVVFNFWFVFRVLILLCKAAIVVAALIVALLAFWFSRKGYQYYQAKSNLANASLRSNELYKGDGDCGDMPYTALQ